MAAAGTPEAEEASISVIKEDSNRIELAILIRDLQPRKGVSRFLHRVKKGAHPQDLVSNATFTRWILTASSLDFEANVHHGHQSNETSTSKLIIRKFPSDIEDVLVDVRQPPGRNYSFLILHARKRPPPVDWKRFLNDNGTLDAGRVDDETHALDKEKEATQLQQEKTKLEEETPRRTVYAESLKKTW